LRLQWTNIALSPVADDALKGCNNRGRDRAVE